MSTNSSYTAKRMKGSSPKSTPSKSGASMRSAAPKRSPRKPEGQKKAGILLGFVLLLVTVAVGIFVFVSLHSSLPEVGTPVEVSFAQGSSAKQFAKELYDKGVISSTSVFTDELTKQNASSKLQPGEYIFKVGQTPDQIISQLIKGPNASKYKLTVPEGLTVTKLADLVEKKFNIPQKEFLEVAKAHGFESDFPFLKEAHNDSLEGFLFPKTYTFKQTPRVQEIITVMLTQYQKETAGLNFEAAQAHIKQVYGVKMSKYDFLTLASVVEKEATNQEEMGKVASVFYNRLKAGKFLQSDATMGYVTGGKVKAQDLKKPSPYNTYLNKGLPVTPICSPSLNALRAVLDPPQTDYFYFWIDNNESAFSKTYDEHLAAIKRAQQRNG